MPPKKPVEPMDVDAILSSFPAAPAPGKKVIAPVQVQVAAPVQVEEAEEAEPKGPPKMYGIYARRVDKFSIRRTRVLMTPAVCPKCRLDLVALNNLEPWDDLSTKVQQELEAGVAEHVRAVHDATEQDIISEDELPKQFLGPKYDKQQLRTQTR